MTETTELDVAHAAMEAAPEDDLARLRFYERLAGGEVFLLLTEEAVGDSIAPELFEVEDQRFVLVFDREDRLAAFAGTVAPFAALSGRALAEMLAGQGIGLALNLDVAPSAMLLPAEAVDWLAATLANAPQEAEARPVEVTAPGALPEALLLALDRRLASAAGLAEVAWLAGVTYADGRRGHVLAIVGSVLGAERAIAATVGEALTFSGLEAGEIDVTFLTPTDPLIDRLARVALRFDLPKPARATAPSAPGMDKNRPPRLR
jgi:hypothetical protein